jgi:riboflavin kinase/FMN adenylyltransferase
VKIYHNISDFKPVKNAIVTVGTFDGIHLGHQAILQKMVEEARQTGGETVVITFYPHPRLVLHLESANLKLISNQQKKIARFREIGIDNLIIIKFTKEFSLTSSEDFIRNYIVEKIKPIKLVVGYDHHFGKDRSGDYKLLYDLGHHFNFEVERIQLQDVENIAVSSTKIRTALIAGDVKKANMLLGYDYTICGKVVHGNEIGRTIGFPTANIATPHEYKLIAVSGVFACRVEWNGQHFDGMGNIGYRPTVSDGHLTVEVHIFDFDRFIYDEEICISFIDRIRNEKKFENIEALRQQLVSDKEQVKQILATYRADR